MSGVKDKVEHVCPICAGQGGLVTVGDHHTCADPLCILKAAHLDRTQSARPTFYEAEAQKVGGRAGGKFLMEDCGGKTDLKTLSPEQWSAFVSTVVAAYRDELQRQGEIGAPPF